LDYIPLLKESLNVQSNSLMKTIDLTSILLQRQRGQIDNLTITDHLVEIKPLGEALVVSDLQL
jgi:hypothetical protein